MKKVTALSLVIILCFFTCGCTNKKEEAKEKLEEIRQTVENLDIASFESVDSIDEVYSKVISGEIDEKIHSLKENKRYLTDEELEHLDLYSEYFRNYPIEEIKDIHRTFEEIHNLEREYQTSLNNIREFADNVIEGDYYFSTNDIEKLLNDVATNKQMLERAIVGVFDNEDVTISDIGDYEFIRDDIAPLPRQAGYDKTAQVTLEDIQKHAVEKDRDAFLSFYQISRSNSSYLRWKSWISIDGDSVECDEKGILELESRALNNTIFKNEYERNNFYKVVFGIELNQN